MKTASNIIAVAGGSAVSVLFIILFNQNGQSSISISLLMFLLSGITTLISGVVGLLSHSRAIYLTCLSATLVALLIGFVFTRDLMELILLCVLSAMLLFQFVTGFCCGRKKKSLEAENKNDDS